MKKTIITSVLAIALVLCSVCALVLTVGAETPEPELNIRYCNLSFRDSICIKYAVESNVSDVKLLIWTAPEADYVIGTQDDVINEWHEEAIKEVNYKVFDYTKIVAKKMGDVLYARAYVRVDGVDYYSQVEKYSVLQYAYNKLGITGTASDNEELKQLLTDMLAYGASAQKYLDDYKIDRLVTDDWYQVKVTAGTLDDGCTHGLYRPGDTVTLVAPETNVNGDMFCHWSDSKGSAVATTATCELTVGTANEVYTPIYTIMASIGLKFTSNGDGTCYVSGVGTCTDTDIIIPTTSPQGDYVTGIGDYAFVDYDNITSITIPNSVTSIGAYAFYCCNGFTSITIPDSVTNIGNSAFNSCSITSITIPNSVTNIGNSAFRTCSKLTSITLPNSLTIINHQTFQDCSSLTSITIPSCVTRIGAGVFEGCSALTSITFEDTSTWYCTEDDTNWGNFTGGASTSMTDASSNASRFKTFSSYRWYKE